ncbi:MAG: SiaB family protein kinase [Candidatus Cloacimonetes bacterium]|nr:SiaB family protein kinase [Candidatus Cloacimonadota bacterium]
MSTKSCEHEFFMSDSDLFSLYSSGGLEKTILMFKGLLTQDILVVLAEMLTNNLSNDPIQKTTKKMFSIFVELAQNIHRYSAERFVVEGKDVGAGIVLVNEFKTYYTLISGNVIDNEKLQVLKNNIEQINNMDEESLKNYRKDKLKQKREEGDKGAGVGLIDIARKSSRQIELRIKELENNKSFISFYILLEKEL